MSGTIKMRMVRRVKINGAGNGQGPEMALRIGILTLRFDYDYEKVYSFGNKASSPNGARPNVQESIRRYLQCSVPE